MGEDRIGLEATAARRLVLFAEFRVGKAPGSGSVAFPRRSKRGAASAPSELAGISRYSSGRLWRQDHRAYASLSISYPTFFASHRQLVRVALSFEPIFDKLINGLPAIRHGAAGSDRSAEACLR